MDYNKIRNTKTKDILLSVAMQDHIIKEHRLNLNLNINLKRELKNKKLTKQTHTKNNKINEIKELDYKKILNKNIISKNEKIIIKKNKDKYYRNLSLAQKMGIVKKPDNEILNEEKWKLIIEKSKRFFNDECCICLEKFKLSKQIILNCGHVFHFNCFNNFEKLLSSRKCPVCRNSNYQKLEMYEGAKGYLNLCITRIQSKIKSILEERLFFHNLIKSNYKCKSMILNRKLIGFKLSLYNNKLINKIKLNDEKLKEYFKKVDLNKIKTEKLIQDYEKNIINIANKNNKNEKPINKNFIKNYFKACIDTINPSDKNFWLKVLNKSKSTQINCSICLNTLNSKKNCILSCSHIFHANCFVFYEKYKENKNLKCPMCRSYYSKLLL